MKYFLSSISESSESEEEIVPEPQPETEPETEILPEFRFFKDLFAKKNRKKYIYTLI